MSNGERILLTCVVLCFAAAFGVTIAGMALGRSALVAGGMVAVSVLFAALVFGFLIFLIWSGR